MSHLYIWTRVTSHVAALQKIPMHVSDKYSPDLYDIQIYKMLDQFSAHNQGVIKSSSDLVSETAISSCRRRL